MKKKFHSQSRKSLQAGQSLLEVLVALGVGIIVAVALINATVAAMRNAQFAKMQNSATKYSQEGIEVIRKYRDQDPNNFWLKSGVYAMPTISFPTLTDASCATVQTAQNKITNDSTFTRCITFALLESEVGQRKMQIDALVWWQDGAGKHRSTQTTYLTEWKQ